MRFFPALLLVLFLSIFLSGCSDTDSTITPTSKIQDFSLQEKMSLAKCLDDKGWVIYSSSTCPACLAQKQAFGEAYTHIKEYECNPHRPDSDVALCIEKNIRKTPTWILERDGQEIMRLEAYQVLDSLRAVSDCGMIATTAK